MFRYLIRRRVLLILLAGSLTFVGLFVPAGGGGERASAAGSSCVGIWSPGFWKHYGNHYTDQYAAATHKHTHQHPSATDEHIHQPAHQHASPADQPAHQHPAAADRDQHAGAADEHTHQHPSATDEHTHQHAGPAHRYADQ